MGWCLSKNNCRTALFSGLNFQTFRSILIGFYWPCTWHVMRRTRPVKVFLTWSLTLSITQNSFAGGFLTTRFVHKATDGFHNLMKSVKRCKICRFGNLCAGILKINFKIGELIKKSNLSKVSSSVGGTSNRQNGGIVSTVAVSLVILFLKFGNEAQFSPLWRPWPMKV